MIAPKRYTSRFTNRFGEEWEFEYDPSNREGALLGSDVDWHEYRVAEGRALGLVLNDEEICICRDIFAGNRSQSVSWSLVQRQEPFTKRV